MISMKKIAVFAMLLCSLIAFSACDFLDGLMGNYFTVSVTATVGGKTSGAGKYKLDDLVVLTATANEGYLFEGWYDNFNNFLTSENKYLLVVQTDASLKAVFLEDISNRTLTTLVKTNEFLLNLGGSVEQNVREVNNVQALKKEKIVSLTAHANIGYHFVGWEVNNQIVNTDAEYEVVLKNNMTIYATFEAIQNVNLSTFIGNEYVTFLANAQNRKFTSMQFLEGNQLVLHKYDGATKVTSEEVLHYGAVGNNLVLKNNNEVQIYPISIFGIGFQLTNNGTLQSYVNRTSLIKMTGNYHFAANSVYQNFVFQNNYTVAYTGYENNQKTQLNNQYYILDGYLIMKSSSIHELGTTVHRYNMVGSNLVLDGTKTLYSNVTFFEGTYYDVFENDDYKRFTKYEFQNNGNLLIYNVSDSYDNEYQEDQFIAKYFIVNNQIVTLIETLEGYQCAVESFQKTASEIKIGEMLFSSQVQHLEGYYYALYIDEYEGNHALVQFDFTLNGTMTATYYKNHEMAETVTANYLILNNNQIILIATNGMSKELEIADIEISTNKVVIANNTELYKDVTYFNSLYFNAIKTEGFSFVAEFTFLPNGKLQAKIEEYSYDSEILDYIYEEQTMEASYLILNGYIVTIVEENGGNSVSIDQIIIEEGYIQIGQQILYKNKRFIEGSYYQISDESQTQLVNFVFNLDGTFHINYMYATPEEVIEEQYSGNYFIFNDKIVMKMQVNQEVIIIDVGSFEQNENSISMNEAIMYRESSKLQGNYYMIIENEEEIGYAIYSFDLEGNLVATLSSYNLEEEVFETNEITVQYLIVQNQIIAIASDYINVTEFSTQQESIIIQGRALSKNVTYLNGQYSGTQANDELIIEITMHFSNEGVVEVMGEYNGVTETQNGTYFILNDKILFVMQDESGNEMLWIYSFSKSGNVIDLGGVITLNLVA